VANKRLAIIRQLAKMIGSSHNTEDIKGVLPPPNVELMSVTSVTRASSFYYSHRLHATNYVVKIGIGSYAIIF